MTCVCDPTRDKQCQLHARAPHPCVCGGTLQRYSGRDGRRMVPVAVLDSSGYVRRSGRSVVLAASSEPFWACNRCEVVK